MQFVGDYHMHTICSDGRAHIEDMVAAGQESGLLEIGIADHGPANIGTGVKDVRDFLTIKKEISRLQAINPSVKCLTGAEADVLDFSGKIDLEPAIIKELDYLIVGLHPFIKPVGLKEGSWLLRNQLQQVFPRLKSRVRNDNTKALVEAIHQFDLLAISHPGLKMPIEITEVAKACLIENTAWEINTGHQFPSYAEVLQAAKCGVDFIVNSDAHFPESVGRLEYGSWVLEKAGVSEARVRNSTANGSAIKH